MISDFVTRNLSSKYGSSLTTKSSSRGFSEIDAWEVGRIEARLVVKEWVTKFAKVNFDVLNSSSLELLLLLLSLQWKRATWLLKFVLVSPNRAQYWVMKLLLLLLWGGGGGGRDFRCLRSLKGW